MRIADLIIGATPTLPARIRSKQVRTGRNTCWRWTGATARKRDGAKRPKICVGGKRGRTVTVARVLLALLDRVPLAVRDAERMEAGHRCGNFWCVNPRHLRWVTRAENEADKHEFDEFCDFAAAVDALAEDEAFEAENSDPA